MHTGVAGLVSTCLFTAGWWAWACWSLAGGWPGLGWQVLASMPNLPLVESSCEDLGHGAGASLLIAVLTFKVYFCMQPACGSICCFVV